MTATSAIFFAIAAICATATTDSLRSPAITNWGVWGNIELCPRGRYAEAFQLKTEANQFRGDDTALNGIRLFCGPPDNPDTAIISSSQGPRGQWGEVFSCRDNNLIRGFQVKVEKPYQGNSDNTATNNIRFYCDASDYVEGDGTHWGSWWGEGQFCEEWEAVCGIRTQVEPDQGNEGDDTALNRIELECCDLLDR